jgi:hypothetical protein
LNQALNWKVGDKADYKLSMGFIKGTMNTIVREEIDKGFWVNQDMDLGFMGKQKVEILFDKFTGAVLEMRVNGEKQDAPDPGDVEIIETRGEKVTVPAGTFEALYAKVKETKNNQVSEVWINPDVVPINGMIKTLSNSQMGKVTVELTAYKKQ